MAQAQVERKDISPTQEEEVVEDTFEELAVKALVNIERKTHSDTTSASAKFMTAATVAGPVNVGLIIKLPFDIIFFSLSDLLSFPVQNVPGTSGDVRYHKRSPFLLTQDVVQSAMAAVGMIDNISADEEEEEVRPPCPPPTPATSKRKNGNPRKPRAKKTRPSSLPALNTSVEMGKPCAVPPTPTCDLTQPPSFSAS